MKTIYLFASLFIALIIYSCNGGDEQKGEGEFLFGPYSNEGTISCGSEYTYTEWPIFMDSLVYTYPGYLTFILTDDCDTKDSRFNISSNDELINKTILVKDGTTFIGTFESSYNFPNKSFTFICEGTGGDCSYEVKTDYYYSLSDPKDTVNEITYACTPQTKLVLIYYNDTQREIPVTVIVTEKCDNGTARVVTRSQLSLMDNLIIPVIQIPTSRKIDVQSGELVFLEYNGEGGNIKYKLVIP